MSVVVRNGPAAPPPEDFLRRANHASVVLGNYVYIDGGGVSRLTSTDDFELYWANNTLSLPLHTSWTNDTVELRLLDRAPGSHFTRAVFWSDESANTAYRIGGYPIEPDEFQYVYKLEADGSGGGEWTEANQPSWLNELSDGSYASTKSTGFYYGGVAINPTVLSFDLIEFDFDSGEWSKQQHQLPPGFGTLQGNAEFVPLYGSEGLFVVLGGTGRTSTADRRATYFDSVTIYDAGSKTWHVQSTSGEVPSYRTLACTVGVPGPRGTFEVFMYGGCDSVTVEVDYDDRAITYYDMYILSIPSFRWFLVPQQLGIPRIYHTCEAVGRRQMLIIGGTDTVRSPSYNEFGKPDPFLQGLGVFDMTETTWKLGYDADAAEYEPPKMVQDWYDKSSMESVDWSSQAVRDLIDLGIAKANPFGSSDDQGSDSPSTGTIVGAVIASLAGIFIIVGIVFWIVRRRKRQREPQPVDQRNSWIKPELAGTEVRRPELPDKPTADAELDQGEVLEAGTEERHELESVVVVHELETAPRESVVNHLGGEDDAEGGGGRSVDASIP